MQHLNGPRVSGAWGLTNYADNEKINHLVAIETADDLLIVAHTHGMLKAWPLNNTLLSFDVGPGRERRIRALAGQGGLVAIGDGNELELWHLGNRAYYESRGEHRDVTTLAIGSWQGAPVLLSGGMDGWLRVWSQEGAQILGIDMDEPVTSLVFLAEDGIAVGTSRGVVIFRLTGTRIPGGARILASGFRPANQLTTPESSLKQMAY